MFTINDEVQVKQSIHVGNATVCGTEAGWMLPGGRETRSESYARMMAIRMSKLMVGYVKEGEL